MTPSSGGRLVVTAGYIRLETAEGLAAQDVAVEVVEALPRVTMRPGSGPGRGHVHPHPRRLLGGGPQGTR